MQNRIRYVSQDHLTGTSTTWDSAANPVASIKYFPYGATRAATGSLDTDIKFTGQRLDTGIDLYYYGASPRSKNHLCPYPTARECVAPVRCAA